jgi:hypothetical protein
LHGERTQKKTRLRNKIVIEDSRDSIKGVGLDSKNALPIEVKGPLLVG